MKLLGSRSLLAFGLAVASVGAVPASSDYSYGSPSKKCSNTPSTRNCWGNYDISTDYYTTYPDTGVTRTFYFELQNKTLAPDGVPRNVLTVNGTIPGPTIEVNWGDTVEVVLINALQNNGSSIHFHGVRQLNTNQMDGTTSITQCPTAPGDSYTYKWKATQYGSSFWHSHFDLQTWEGVFGGLIIHGPATSNYDVDLGNLFIQDWSHQTADALYTIAETQGAPTLDTGLINGTNVYAGAGERFSTNFTSGNKYLLRVVNAAIDSHFKFSIDQHNLTVIASDFVPIKPYTTDVLNVNIGERYDVIVEANQPPGDYWLRAYPAAECSNNGNSLDIKGIVRYDPNSTADPTSTGYAVTDSCVDEPAASLVPYVAKNVGSATVNDDFEVTLATVDDNLVKWYINNVTLRVEWSDPTLLEVYNGNSTFNASEAVIELPTANEWAYFVIEQGAIQAHPIHLHGHDFYVLASGTGTYDTSNATLQTTNPPRRDVATLPTGGYLVIAFQADNPGAWLLHCHIGWHQEGGFALQTLEQESNINIDATALKNTCNNWNAYTAANNVIEIEDYSGI